MESYQRKHPASLPLLYTDKKPNIIFLTVCTHKRRQILALPESHQTLITAWTKADHWQVGHYLIMPDHIHLFCSPANPNHLPVKAWVKYWKSIASQNWPDNSEHPIWQIDCWDSQLRTGDSYTAKWDYVQQNPIRAKRVDRTEDWPYKGKQNDLFWQ
ncbi:transposase [Pelagicoccus mobilis]|uniref:Transposase n=1 Tax=Pelagicoccus mobilis TaxID=415221 RepID=A0A934RVM6_9BACT|nr:transposase [Pelagicoccus mobilis]MBK1876270.1 transposase [Pelagicoccus mobilis]